MLMTSGKSCWQSANNRTFLFEEKKSRQKKTFRRSPERSEPDRQTGLSVRPNEVDCSGALPRVKPSDEQSAGFPLEGFNCEKRINTAKLRTELARSFFHCRQFNGNRLKSEKHSDIEMLLQEKVQLLQHTEHFQRSPETLPKAYLPGIPDMQSRTLPSIKYQCHGWYPTVETCSDMVPDMVPHNTAISVLSTTLVFLMFSVSS